MIFVRIFVRFLIHLRIYVQVKARRIISLFTIFLTWLPKKDPLLIMLILMIILRFPCSQNNFTLSFSCNDRALVSE